MIAPGAMGFTMAPAYGGYPIVNSSVVPIGQSPMGTPMMVVPGYAPSCVPVPVYSTTNQAPGVVPSQGHPAPRPKPLSEEVS